MRVDDRIDDSVDNEILECLNLSSPKSFFLFAGAGSGKTRSLVSVLREVSKSSGRHLRFRGQQVAVITYTNAACDEIHRRLNLDPLIRVSTIHSFVWDLIQGFNSDIREWVRVRLTQDLSEISQKATKGRAGSKAAIERQRSFESKQAKLGSLDQIRKFIYSPTGENRSRASLSHTEVIEICASFLNEKPLMRQLLVCKYPILLIDESQDTNRILMEALLSAQGVHQDRFAIGLFGDTMQRIYSDGKVDLGRNLPDTWAKPAKVLNHRCPKRVVELINKIRSAADDQQQKSRSDAKPGHACLFITNIQNADRADVEKRVREEMMAITSDAHWKEPEKVKTLILEHHMAARRLGFFPMHDALQKIDAFRTGLRDGTLPPVQFFSETILPLVMAHRAGNAFAIADVVRNKSPLLSKRAFAAIKADQTIQMKAANSAVETLMKLFAAESQPKFFDVLLCVAKSDLFEIPSALFPFAYDHKEETPNDEADEEEATPEETEAIRAFLDTPFSQIEKYSAYIKGESPFGTHQGVKGLEFPRVLVVMDDEGAGGFLFSYEKLFGAKDKSDTDLSNEASGKETGIDRTRRLFYVTCSRSESGLAIVAYSSRPDLVKAHALAQGWFSESEIRVI